MNRNRKELIHEWLDKATGDAEAVSVLYKSRRKQKFYYIIAFHCQQSIEKYLKALLICHGIYFPKTHDLVRLLQLIKKKDPFLSALEKDLTKLTPYAVGFRYPGEDIEKQELQEAMPYFKRTKKILLKRIKEFL